LFLLFINDDEDIVFILCMGLFADDVKLHSSLTHSLSDLQVVFDKLVSLAETGYYAYFDKCSVHRFVLMSILQIAVPSIKPVLVCYVGQMRLDKVKSVNMRQMPNLVETSQAVAEIWRFVIFQNGCRSPSSFF